MDKQYQRKVIEILSNIESIIKGTKLPSSRLAFAKDLVYVLFDPTTTFEMRQRLYHVVKSEYMPISIREEVDKVLRDDLVLACIKKELGEKDSISVENLRREFDGLGESNE